MLFLDEPSTVHDPQSRQALWEILRALRDEGRTVVQKVMQHHMASIQ